MPGTRTRRRGSLRGHVARESVAAYASSREPTVAEHGLRSLVRGDGPLERLSDLAEATHRLLDCSEEDLAAGLDDRDLLEFTASLDRQVTRLEALRSRALRTVERRQAYAEDACVSTASWLRMRTRRDPRQTSGQAKAAKRLRHFDRLREAYERGEVTTDHVQVITRAAIPRRRAAFVEVEDVLVDVARSGTPRDLAALCRKIADAVDKDGTETAPLCDAGPDERRTFELVRTVDGLGDLRATLDPVTAERLENLLHSLSTFDPPGTPEEEQRTPTQRRHDAFDQVLRAAEEHPRLPTVHGSRPRVLLSIDLMTLLGNGDLATRRTKLGSGTEIDLGRALRLLEEGTFTPVLMWGPFRPVGVGRTQRTLPAWLRPLLTMVHETCCGPGCDRPIPWTQAAHTDAWTVGCDTHFDRTFPACGGHHRLADVAGWDVTVDPVTRVCSWTSPDGKTVLRTHPPDP